MYDTASSLFTSLHKQCELLCFLNLRALTIPQVIGVLYRCDDTVSRIEQKLKDIKDMECSEELASRRPPLEYIRNCKM